MKLTIVTICLNSEDYIQRCLVSVIENSVDHINDVEYLILDGGSTDQTCRLARTTVNGLSFVRFISERDNGIYDAYNKGINLARGTYIWFVNSDDVPLTHSVDTVLRYIDEAQDQVIHCFSVRRIHDLLSKSHIHKRSLESVIRKFSPVCHTPGIIFPKKVLTQLGFFDTKFKICGDFELLQKALVSYSFSNHDECIIDMHLGGVSSNKKFEYLKMKEQISIIGTLPYSCKTKIFPIIKIFIKYCRNRFVNPVLIRHRQKINAE